ncbi:MAG TPA: hypothetical protein VEI02_13220 [Planctomycetota bacterium]|nr:hypothetical protein [Planctomycetota bacterium]
MTAPCAACGSGSLTPDSSFRFGSRAGWVGAILAVGSFLWIVLAVAGAWSRRPTFVHVGSFLDWLGAVAAGLTVPIVAGVVGLLALSDRRVLRCSRCTAVFDRA